jgi:hypothetical protein
MEPYGTPASISLGVDSSPSTETLNFLWDKYVLISFIKLTVIISIIYITSQVKGFLNVQEYRSRGNNGIKI